MAVTLIFHGDLLLTHVSCTPFDDLIRDSYPLHVPVWKRLIPLARYNHIHQNFPLYQLLCACATHWNQLHIITSFSDRPWIFFFTFPNGYLMIGR